MKKEAPMRCVKAPDPRTDAPLPKHPPSREHSKAILREIVNGLSRQGIDSPMPAAKHGAFACNN